jgi:hypothetical protein
VRKNLILSCGGGGSLEVYNSRHETAYVNSGSVSLMFLQIEGIRSFLESKQKNEEIRLLSKLQIESTSPLRILFSILQSLL